MPREGIRAGAGSLILSKQIIKKLKSKSIKLNDLTNSIKRGVPNSKLKFVENSSLIAVKSTLLEYSYFLPKSEVFIEYLEEKDLKTKSIEFESDFVLLPRTTLKIRAILKNNDYHVLDRIYYFRVNNIDYNNKFVLGVLNSALTTFYYDNIYGSTKIGGGYIDLKGSQIENFLIPKCPKNKQQIIIIEVDKILLSYKKIIEQSQKFQRTLQRKFELDSLPKKLENWYELSFAEFVKELAKKKVKLSLSEEAEWEDYFLQEQQKAVAIKNEIVATDKAIDKMVYELYGLSEEEIKIVEES